MTDSSSVRFPRASPPRALAGRPGKVSRPSAAGHQQAAPQRPTRLVGWLAVAGIGGSLLIMLAAAAFRQYWMFPHLRLPSPGFPFAVQGAHAPKRVVIAGLWLAELMAAGGLVAGLVAARRGARPPMRLLLIGAGLAVGVMAVLPPAGSTDALDYASFGRLLLLGHNPYVAPAFMLRATDPGFARSVPQVWQHQVSLYGPAATFEQYVAARLGGDVPARVVFWLKIWNAAAFGAVAVAADKLLRHDPAKRLRAHLLWTVNPLLIWGLVEAGHVDVLAAGAGLLGLLVIRPGRGASHPAVLRALVAGALVGLAADIKINFIVFGVGLAWGLRRTPAAFLAAAAGGAAVLAPSYAWFGPGSVRALLARRNQTTVDSFYRLLGATAHESRLGLLGVVLTVGLVVLLLVRMPPGYEDWPAIRPALAISLGWLVLWPYQLPWYDAMAICLLLFYPASRIDWLMIARLTVPTLANTPGNPAVPPGHVLTDIDQFIVHVAAPLTLLGCAIALVALALTGRWMVCDQDELALLRLRLDGGHMTLTVHRLHLATIGAADGMPVHGFVVSYPGGAVLVDTGVGGPQQWLTDWRVVNRSVADALDDLGMTPGDVGLVINTHLHFDHCGQNAVFKHAAFYVQRAELDRARRESPELAGWFDFMNARFELLDGDAEILPGLSVVASPGHTVGHQSVLVSPGDGRSDLLIGDAAYTPLQYHEPEAEELPPGQASDVDAWRRSLRRMRAALPARVHFCHSTDVVHS